MGLAEVSPWKILCTAYGKEYTVRYGVSRCFNYYPAHDRVGRSSEFDVSVCIYINAEIETLVPSHDAPKTSQARLWVMVSIYE